MGTHDKPLAIRRHQFPATLESGDTRLSPFPDQSKVINREGEPNVVQPLVAAYRSIAEDYPQ